MVVKELKYKLLIYTLLKNYFSYLERIKVKALSFFYFHKIQITNLLSITRYFLIIKNLKNIYTNLFIDLFNIIKIQRLIYNY